MLGNPSATSPAQVGGLLGIAACLIGLAIFVAGCFGLNAAFIFSPLPLALGAAGLLLTFFGGLFFKGKAEDTHVVAALFISLFGIVGALLEMSVWLHWTIFQKAG
jgi:hypothetical protein